VSHALHVYLRRRNFVTQLNITADRLDLKDIDRGEKANTPSGDRYHPRKPKLPLLLSNRSRNSRSLQSAWFVPPISRKTSFRWVRSLVLSGCAWFRPSLFVMISGEEGLVPRKNASVAEQGAMWIILM
jgi:hypothetical protein